MSFRVHPCWNMWRISFFNAWKWKVKVKSLSCVQLLATPWTAAYQAPPSMGFPRQEYWSGVPLPSLNRILFSLKKEGNPSHVSTWMNPKGHYAVITRTLCNKPVIKRRVLTVHGTLLNVTWQPGWETSLEENGYMYIYGWVPLPSTWNYHNIANWLYSTIKQKIKKLIHNGLNRKQLKP